MTKVQQGFTLIELMIVVAIVGILAAIAVPAYQDYTIRAKMSDALSQADMARTAVSEYRQSNGSFPTTNALAGLSTTITSTYVSNLQVAAAGRINVTVSVPGSGNGIISLLPTVSTNGGAINWACGQDGTTTVQPKYRPSSCR
jgi:type IV pilus assembly protein PilA